MKHKILGLLAALGLATAAPAQSAIIYTLESFVNDTAFVLTVPELISANTAFDLSAFDSITAPTDTLNVSFWDPLTGPTVDFNGLVGPIEGFFWETGFTGPGTYCAGGSCGGTSAIMTIRESSTVPEPGTLALLGLGLAGLGFTRRRRTN